MARQASDKKDRKSRAISYEQVMNEVNKKVPNAFQIASEAKGLTIKRIPTGSLALDVELGGGWPQGRISEIHGKESVAKTTLVYKTIAANQAKYPDAKFAWIDFEGVFDREWAATCGVDNARLGVVSLDTMEEGLDAVEALVDSGDCFLIVIDSWAAAVPAAEKDAEMGQATMALRARLGNKFIRKFRPKHDDESAEVDLGRTTLLVINQSYDSFNSGPVPSTTTPGGRQLKYACSVRVEFKRGYDPKDPDIDPSTGRTFKQIVNFHTVKNKTYPPRRKGSFTLFVDTIADDEYVQPGKIDIVEETAIYGIMYGIVHKAGAWYYYKDSKFHGKADLISYLLENEEEQADIYDAIMDMLARKVYRLEEEDEAESMEEE
jgi:recombination protein RecA